MGTSLLPEKHSTTSTDAFFYDAPVHNLPEGIGRFIARFTSLNREFNAPGTYVHTLQETIGNGLLQAALVGSSIYGIASHLTNDKWACFVIPEIVNIVWRSFVVKQCLEEQIQGASWFPGMRRK